ncbi:unnamed protein product [Sympodiomycopsis kandeliae]
MRDARLSSRLSFTPTNLTQRKTSRRHNVKHPTSLAMTTPIYTGIRPLPTSVSDLIQSSSELPDLSSIVAQLVYNSIDAGAGQVDVILDLPACSIQCIDDGRGFDTQAIQTLSSGGHISRSSGNSLARMASIGILCIESHHVHIQRGQQVIHSSLNTNAYYNGKTSVTIKDIYHSIPIRRPSHLNDSSSKRQVEDIKKSLTTISLRHPIVRFSLRSIDGNQKSRQVLHLAQEHSIASRFIGLFFPFLSAQDWMDIGCSRAITTDVTLKIKAVVILQPHSTRSHQYIYLQSHLLSSDTTLYDHWTDIHAQEGLTMATTSASKDTKSVHKRVSDTVKRGFDHTTLRGHPAYLIDLHLIRRGHNGDAVRVLDEQVVVQAVCQAIEKGFTSRGLLSETKVKANGSSPSTPSTKVKANVPSIEGSSQLEVSTPSTKVKTNGSSQVASSVGRRTQSGPASSSASLARRPSASVTLPTIFPAALKSSPHRKQFEKYTDPSTSRTYWIDLRTGNSYPYNHGQRPPSTAPGDQIKTTQHAVHLSRSRLNTSRPPTADSIRSCTSTPSWLSDVVKTWTNPVLPRPQVDEEPCIPILNQGVHGSRYDKGVQTKRERLVPLPNWQLRSPFFRDDQTSEGALDAGALRGARVLSQVSNQVIMAVLPQGNVVVAIDQHAADERVRYEYILDEYITGCLHGPQCAYTLKEPLHLWLPSHSCTPLSDPSSNASRALHFFGFTWSLSTTCHTETEVLITSVPTPVSLRLRQDPSLAQQILTECLDYPPVLVLSSTWTSYQGLLPSTLLDLLKSQACRGSIMFNDPLTTEQCERLVSQLAMTKFPLSCAHGRPTVVPLYTVGKAKKRTKVDWNNLSIEL